MLNVNQSSSQKLAQTIQRDYEQSAQNYRLRNQHHVNREKGLGFNVSFLMTMLAIAFVTIIQYLT